MSLDEGFSGRLNHPMSGWVIGSLVGAALWALATAVILKAIIFPGEPWLKVLAKVVRIGPAHVGEIVRLSLLLPWAICMGLREAIADARAKRGRNQNTL